MSSYISNVLREGKVGYWRMMDSPFPTVLSSPWSGEDKLVCEVPSCSKTLVLMFPDDDAETPEEMEDEIPVVICAAAGRMGAAMAAINSIYSNTDANILFYVVGLRNTLSRIR